MPGVGGFTTLKEWRSCCYLSRGCGEAWEEVESRKGFILGMPSNRESFSPSGFLLGEKVPKADEGAFHE